VSVKKIKGTSVNMAERIEIETYVDEKEVISTTGGKMLERKAAVDTIEFDML
jgi:hypothetical protein